MKAFAIAAVVLLTATPAYADDGDRKKHSDCSEVEEEASCSDDDASPTFTDSPVDISGNSVQICLPFSDCRGEEPAPAE